MRSRRNFDAIDPGFQGETRNGDQSEKRNRISPLRRFRTLPPSASSVVAVAGDGGAGVGTIRVSMGGGEAYADEIWLLVGS